MAAAAAAAAAAARTMQQQQAAPHIIQQQHRSQPAAAHHAAIAAAAAGRSARLTAWPTGASQPQRGAGIGGRPSPFHSARVSAGRSGPPAVFGGRGGRTTATTLLRIVVARARARRYTASPQKNSAVPLKRCCQQEIIFRIWRRERVTPTFSE
jgi:hypothetical protein